MNSKKKRSPCHSIIFVDGTIETIVAPFLKFNVSSHMPPEGSLGDGHRVSTHISPGGLFEVLYPYMTQSGAQIIPSVFSVCSVVYSCLCELCELCGLFVQ